MLVLFVPIVPIARGAARPPSPCRFRCSSRLSSFSSSYRWWRNYFAIYAGGQVRADMVRTDTANPDSPPVDDCGTIGNARSPYLPSRPITSRIGFPRLADRRSDNASGLPEFGLAYGLMRLFKVEHSVAAPGALHWRFELLRAGVATAIALFGPESGAALATVVGVLVEVPVMLSVCTACNRTRHWFPSTPATS